MPIASRIDVRTVPPRERHPLIFSTFGGLQPGQALELVNDHDPRPLFQQFAERMPGQFDWSYLEQGPTWRVAISRTATAERAQGAGSCCGGCGGGH